MPKQSSPTGHWASSAWRQELEGRPAGFLEGRPGAKAIETVVAPVRASVIGDPIYKCVSAFEFAVATAARQWDPYALASVVMVESVSTGVPFLPEFPAGRLRSFRFRWPVGTSLRSPTCRELEYECEDYPLQSIHSENP